MFTNGNAGDIFCKDIINYYYPNLKIINSNKKNRILIIGSLIHNLQSGDLICGVGIKNFNLNFCPNVQIKGIRGYRTYEFLKKKKFDLTNLSFISDPGLIISKIFNVTRKKKIEV